MHKTQSIRYQLSSVVYQSLVIRFQVPVTDCTADIKIITDPLILSVMAPAPESDSTIMQIIHKRVFPPSIVLVFSSDQPATLMIVWYYDFATDNSAASNCFYAEFSGHVW